MERHSIRAIPRIPTAVPVVALRPRWQAEWCRSHNPLGTGDVDPQVVRETEATVRLLESLGHSVVPGYPKQLEDQQLIGNFTALWDAGLVASINEAQRAVGAEPQEGDFEALTIEMAEGGGGLTAQQLIEAVATVQRLGFETAQWWSEDGFDLLLTPTLAEPPVPLGTFVNNEAPILGFLRAAAFAPFCAGFNITGQPAISLPLGSSDSGMPIGIHFVAAYGREDLLIRVAAQLETAAPWSGRRPAIHA